MPFINIDDYDPIELAPGARARTPYGKNVMLSYLELDAPGGHDAFLLADPRYHGALAAYFGNIEL